MKRALLLFLLATAESAMPDSMFHGNLAHSGVYESAGPKEFHGVKWTFKTDGPIVGSATVADGVVYVGSTDNLLYAIDQETGKQKWKFKTLGSRAITSTPAVVNGVVYFQGFDGVFYALAADTGTPKWNFLTEYERRFEAKRLHGYPPGQQTIPDSWDFYTSSPAVFNGKVYFGGGDGNVYALEIEKGVLQWKFPTGDTVHGSPAIANNTVYIGSWDSNLYALDAETGQEKWRFHAGEDAFIHNQQGFQSSPTVVDGVVYVGCRDGHIYAIDAASGRKKWDYSTAKNWVNATPAVRDGVVFAGTSFGFRLHALDVKTGRARFTFEAGGELFSSPALSGDMLYVGGANGILYALDAKSGKSVWQFRTESSKSDPMKVLKPDASFDDGVLYAPYFRDHQDMVLAIYRIFSVGSFWSSPVVDRGTIYIGSTDGNLYAIQ
jgi:outer membrane protein assembly factor BamB